MEIGDRGFQRKTEYGSSKATSKPVSSRMNLRVRFITG
jgi:hypothetical protein